MAVLAFIDAKPGTVLPGTVLRLLGKLEAENVPVHLVSTLAALSEDQIAQVSHRFFGPELQAVMVFASCPTTGSLDTRERILQLRLLFPDQVKMLIDGALSFSPAGCVSLAMAELFQQALALHGKFSESFQDSSAAARPKYLARHAVEVILSEAPCDGICAACPSFSGCAWQAVPTWGRYPIALKSQFEEQLSQAGKLKCSGLYIRDFMLGNEPEKLAWAGSTIATRAPGLPWVADLSLDQLSRAPDVLTELASQGLAGINLDMISLHAESRRARGGLPFDVQAVLAALRAAAPNVAIHGQLAIGLPGDSIERVSSDFSWLLSSEGRALLDSLVFQPQSVYPGTILSHVGGYHFETTGAWRLPSLTQHQSVLLSDKLNHAVHKLNPVIARWRSASDLLATAVLGVGYHEGLQLLRSSWVADENLRAKVVSCLDSFELSYLRGLTDALVKETF